AKKRAHGKANYTFLKLFKLALSTFVSMSLFPLKLTGYLGLLITSLSGSFGFYLFVSKYFFDSSFAQSFSGPAQLAILIVFLVGIILMSLGIIALYIASIQGEIRNRPMYVVWRKKL
ncbi:MAG: glycosyltransferase, partial [Candidatus Falkowbacteria bacterium]|nr:glycosyltransferase [Candidatus Falkowbacteria bacterium]